MEVGKERLADFIGDKRIFTIPVYQRNYDWQIDNCKKLFYDIENVIGKDKNHFLGTLVYQQISTANILQELIIIDGQQRITSILLFIKALYDLTDDEDIKEEIKTSFLKKFKANPEHPFKLKPIEYDREIFEKLLNYDEFNENNFSSAEKSKNIYKNYYLFKVLIKNSINRTENSITISQFYEAVYKLEIVKILLDMENPQEIFESLNSTGLDLSNTDLIRNYLLMPLDYDHQEDLYKKYWHEIEKLIQPDNMEIFITQYLITKRKSDSIMQNDKKSRLTMKNLYRSFKEYFEKDEELNKGQNKVEDFFKDLYRYANFYKHFIFNNNTVFAKLSALDKKFYELMYLLEATHSPIILMYLYDKYDRNKISENVFCQLVDILISFAFRARVCRTNLISSQFAGNVINKLEYIKINNNSLNDFWDVITFGKGNYAFPKDKQFLNSLLNESLYTTIKSDGCKYLLYSLELNSGHAKEIPAYDKSSIEHIIPQKLNSDWKKYLQSKNDFEIYRQYLHTLGNLTLTNYNEKLQNANFNMKKEEYAQSNYYYTKELISYNDWTSKQIRLRAERLANLALKIWILPEEFKSRSVNIDDIFNLDSDFGALTKTKPASILILEKEIKISNWIDFPRVVVKQLYALNEDVFRQAVCKENIPRKSKLFSADPQNLQKPFKVDENYYMENRLSTGDCLKIVKAIAENFDKLGDTNFREDIYFTLRR